MTYDICHCTLHKQNICRDIADIWSSMSSHFVASQWRCLTYYIKYRISNDTPFFDAERYATDCLDALDTASFVTLVHLFDAIELLMPKVDFVLFVMVL